MRGTKTWVQPVPVLQIIRLGAQADKEGGTKEATRTKTPPPTSTPMLEAPPPPSKDPGMTATVLPYTTTSERYETNKHNILVTFLTHEMVITFVTMFCQAYKYSPDQSISRGGRLSWPL
jgi:hypothetical protein